MTTPRQTLSLAGAALAFMGTASGALAQDLPRHKSPALAAVMSAVIPGTGQFYNGRTVKGVLHLAVAGVASGVAIVGFASADCAGYYESYFDYYLNSFYSRWVPGSSCAVGYSGLALAAGIRVLSLLDASAGARRINRQATVASVHLEPWLGDIAAGQGVRPAMRLRINLRTSLLAR
jgi:TM2 domain-containing membrane protein YozV